MLYLTPNVELVYRDRSGSQGATTLHVDYGSTVAEASAAGIALASAIAPLTDAVLVKLRVKYVMRPDMVSSAVGTAPISQRGVFIFDCGGSPLALIELPSTKDVIFMSSGAGAGVLVDTTNSDVITFVDEAITDIFTNVFGDDITTLAAAYRQSRV